MAVWGKTGMGGGENSYLRPGAYEDAKYGVRR